MFWSVLRTSSGVNHHALRNYYVSAWSTHPDTTLTGTSQSTHPDTTLTGTSQVYTYRQHTATDWNAMR